MKAEYEAQLAEEARLKLEEHKRAWPKVEEGICLDLEARRRAEEGGHTWIEAEEDARLVEENRMKV